MGPENLDRLYGDFWREFGDRLSTRSNTPLYVDETLDLSESYLPQKKNLPSGVNYTFVCDSRSKYLQLKFHIHDKYDHREQLYTYLEERQADIDSVLNTNLKWTRTGGYDHILLERQGDVSQRDSWQEFFDWFIRYGEIFHTLFGVYLKEFER